MHILIAVASKHGSTREIADALANTLIEDGNVVDVREVEEVEEVESVAGYHAVIVGSAVYFGKWRPSAVRFIRSQTACFTSIPVWIFSSGPTAKAATDRPLDVTRYVALAHAKDHRHFGGQLDVTTLGPVEKLITRAVHAEPGDQRDWDDVRAWGREIALALREQRAAEAKVA